MKKKERKKKKDKHAEDKVKKQKHRLISSSIFVGFIIISFLELAALFLWFSNSSLVSDLRRPKVKV